MVGFFVDGLSEHVVWNIDGIVSLLRTGARLRTTGSMKMNEVQMIYVFHKTSEVMTLPCL